MEMVNIMLKGGAGNENIIEIDKSKRKILEKGLGCITEAIGHVEILKEAKRSNNSSFGNIRGMHRNLIGLHQI